MPKEKSDFRLVADEAKEGEDPAALRLTKTVRGADESTYTFLLPGVVPDPLKLTIHPAGEIQLKSRKAGLITRLNKEVLIQRLLSGSLDDTLARFLTPRLNREAAEGFLLGSELLPLGGAGTSAPLRDVDLSIGRFLDSLTKLQIEDATKIDKAIVRLREDGLLPEKTMLHLVTETTEEPIVFFSVLDRPLGKLPADIPIPNEFPFPKSFRALLNSLARYGGILFTMPSEAEIAEMAKVVGLGDLHAGLTRFVDALNEPDVGRHIGGVMGEIVEGLKGPIREVARAKPLRPLRSPKRTRERRAPPPGGWVRRRPRRRGHTAPLPKSTN